MNNILKRNILLCAIILLAAISRLLPHPLNFSPIAALSLFGAAYFTNKSWAFIAPLVATFISDLILNNTLYASMHPTFTWFYTNSIYIYIAVAITTLLGMYLLKSVSVKNIALGALASSVLFFFITNYSSWIGNPMYTQDFSGLVNCYTAGIPFFGGTIMGTVFYSALLFGGFELAKKQFPSLQLAHA
jgi:hypothetical protein